MKLVRYTCQTMQCNFVAQDSHNMLRHLSTIHLKDKNFTSPCLYTTDCFHKVNFKTLSCLKHHLSKFHPLFFSLSGNVTEANSNGTPSDQSGMECVANSDDVDSPDKCNLKFIVII
jgi:hypothetical protein